MLFTWHQTCSFSNLFVSRSLCWYSPWWCNISANPSGLSEKQGTRVGKHKGQDSSFCVSYWFSMNLPSFELLCLFWNGLCLSLSKKKKEANEDADKQTHKKTFFCESTLFIDHHLPLRYWVPPLFPVCITSKEWTVAVGLIKEERAHTRWHEEERRRTVKGIRHILIHSL